MERRGRADKAQGSAFAGLRFGDRWVLHCVGRNVGSMPTVMSVSGFRFFFYSLEGSEPAHIHVERGQSTAKFWLDPVQLARSRGLRSHELNRLRALVIEHRVTFKEAWIGHFGTEA